MEPQISLVTRETRTTDAGKPSACLEIASPHGQARSPLHLDTRSDHWMRWGPKTELTERNGIPLKGVPGDSALLARRTVALLGLGAVGGVVLIQLARLGVGRLIGVDPDQYEEDSWQTQPCGPGQRGRAKAAVIGQLAHETNPFIQIATTQRVAQDLPLSALCQADMWIAAGDNLELIVWAGVQAGRLGKVLIQGAVHGETGTCLVRCYDRCQADGPCPGCQLSSEWNQRANLQGCDPKNERLRGAEPTRTNPAICQMTAQLVVNEAVKWLAADGQAALRDEELAISLIGHRLWRSKLQRNDHCRCPHETWRQIDLSKDAATQPLGRVLRDLGIQPDRRSTTPLRIKAERPWFGEVDCLRCGESTSVRRFARLGQTLGPCTCGANLTAQRLNMKSSIPASDLAACFAQPLTQLGLGPGDTMAIDFGGSCRLCLLPGQSPFVGRRAHGPTIP